jgi:hypothetical protein
MVECGDDRVGPCHPVDQGLAQESFLVQLPVGKERESANP